MSEAEAQVSLAEGLARFVEGRLKSSNTTALEAFHKLCRLGCDRLVLAELFAWFSTTEPIPLQRDNGKLAKRVYLHALDSWETALDPRDGGPPLTPEQLKDIAKGAKELLGHIKRLKRTPLVRQLIRDGQILPEDLLAGTLPKTALFQGLLQLPETVSPSRQRGRLLKPPRQFGPQARPGYEGMLKRIYTYIHERTGVWHDAEVGAIARQLDPHSDDDPDAKRDGWTQTALKKWRGCHGLKTPRPKKSNANHLDNS